MSKYNTLITDRTSLAEKEFEYDFHRLIKDYKDYFLSQGWREIDFLDWCHELVDKYI